HAQRGRGVHRLLAAARGWPESAGAGADPARAEDGRGRGTGGRGSRRGRGGRGRLIPVQGGPSARTAVLRGRKTAVELFRPAAGLAGRRPPRLPRITDEADATR